MKPQKKPRCAECKSLCENWDEPTKEIAFCSRKCAYGHATKEDKVKKKTKAKKVK